MGPGRSAIPVPPGGRPPAWLAAGLTAVVIVTAAGTVNLTRSGAAAAATAQARTQAMSAAVTAVPHLRGLDALSTTGEHGGWAPTSARVSRAGIESASPDRVVVLAFIDLTSTTRIEQRPVRMTLVPGPGTWVVADLQVL